MSSLARRGTDSGYAAVPPDVRWWLRPTGSWHPNRFGATPLVGGAAPVQPGPSGRAQPFRTSGGTAAKRVFTQFLPRGGTDFQAQHRPLPVLYCSKGLGWYRMTKILSHG